MTLNALYAADSVLVPVQGEYYALEDSAAGEYHPAGTPLLNTKLSWRASFDHV
ncbi:MAG: hypothetical protein ACLTYN_16750 [Dysosmobacter welbionis]